MADAYRDGNSVPTLIAASNADGSTPVRVWADPATHRLLVDSAGAGSGTVTDVSVVSANGFAGTVANSTTTPAITISTTVTGITKGNGTALSAATAGSDYTALAFKTIVVAGQSDIVADSAADTLTVAAGTGITLTTDAATDTLTIANTSATATDIKVGTTTVSSGTDTRILYDNAGTLGEYTLTGSGTVVAMQTSPTFVTGVTLSAANIITDTTTGTKIGTATNQKLGFFNSAPIAQPTGDIVTALGSLGLVGTPTVAATSIVVGTTTITSGTNTRILYDNSGVLGEYTLTGSGTAVAMGTSPVFTTGITSPQVLASANDSGALGASGTAFSDLFLASGGVINWAAANVTLTQSSGILTQNNGELRITSANVGTNADSVPTLSSTSTMTNKTLTSPVLQTTPVIADGANVIITVPSVDGTATGDITNAFNSGYTSTAVGDLVYLDASATWQKAKADAASTSSGLLGIALEVKASGAAVKVLLQGYAYMATAFPTTDSVTRVLGFAVNADKMWFAPSPDYITHT